MAVAAGLGAVVAAGVDVASSSPHAKINTVVMATRARTIFTWTRRKILN
jgi:hypothetical protein